MGVTETNQVRMFGVLPSHGADPIPVEVAAWGADPISVPPAAMISQLDTYDWSNAGNILKNRAALTAQNFYCPVYFPDAVTVSALTLFGYRDDALASMILTLYRDNRANAATVLGTVTADWLIGYSNKSDLTISTPIIDNTNYDYLLRVSLDPNNSVEDVKFSGARITFS